MSSARTDRKKEIQKDKEAETRRAGLLAIFIEFLKLGTFTIGGGVAMIPMIEGIVTEKNKWMTEEEVIDCIAVSQSLPGVIAINMATYVGFRKRGIAGAVLATVGVIIPSLVSIIAVIKVLTEIGDNRYVAGALAGVRASALGMIAYSAYKIVEKVLHGVFAWIVAAAAFASVYFLNVNVVFVVICSAAAGIAMHYVNMGRAGDLQ